MVKVAVVSDNASQELRWSDGPGIIESAWRYKAVIVAATIVIVIVGFFVSRLLPPRFEAISTVVVSDSDAFNQDPPDPERRVRQEESRLTSQRVYRRAAEQLGGLSVEDLKDVVDIAADPVAGEIEVTAGAPTRERAVAIANAVVDAYEQANRNTADERLQSAQAALEQQAEDLRNQIRDVQGQVLGSEPSPMVAQQRESLQSQLSELDARSTELAADVALYGSGIKQIERAVAPDEPSSPKPVRDAALAGIIGFCAASALAYWRAGYVDSMKLDPARMLNAPLLAEIPEFRPASGERMSALLDIEAAEAYQFLLASFEYAVARSNARSVLITSASPGDGKSLTSLQLAQALAIQGRSVCLVDSDIRVRGLSTLLRAEDTGGLVALAEGAELDTVVRQYRISEQIRLSFVPAGEPGSKPTGLLGTNRYREAISKIISDNELTIIDSGPLLTVADAWAISALVSGIILVVDAEISREDLVKLRNRMRLIPTPVLGIVINRVRGAGVSPYPYGPAPAQARRRSWILPGRQRSDQQALSQ